MSFFISFSVVPSELYFVYSISYVLFPLYMILSTVSDPWSVLYLTFNFNDFKISYPSKFFVISISWSNGISNIFWITFLRLYGAYLEFLIRSFVMVWSACFINIKQPDSGSTIIPIDLWWTCPPWSIKELFFNIVDR